MREYLFLPQEQKKVNSDKVIMAFIVAGWMLVCGLLATAITSMLFSTPCLIIQVALFFHTPADETDVLPYATIQKTGFSGGLPLDQHGPSRRQEARSLLASAYRYAQNLP
jgi:hypothetical protein